MTLPVQLDSRSCRALSQTVSWLTASGIQSRYLGGLDIGVVTGDGDEIRVHVAVNPDDISGAEAADFILQAEKLLSTDMAVARKAFSDITEAAGFGRDLNPIDRGEMPNRRFHYDNDFELVCMRHREFRRVPNPKSSDLLLYQKVMAQESFRFYNRPGNYGLCYRNGLTLDDLNSYAAIWTTNYLGLYRILEEIDNDNCKKLKIHLRQRFGELGTILANKQRSCLPCAEAAFLGASGVTQSEAVIVLGPDNTVLDVSIPNVVGVDEHLARKFESMTLGQQKLAVEAAISNPQTPGSVLDFAKKFLESLTTGKPMSPEAETNKKDSKPRKMDAGESLFPREYVAIMAKSPQTKVCPRCGKLGNTSEDFGFRLMNKKQIGTEKPDGTRVGPKFAMQAQCRGCRCVSANKKDAQKDDPAQS